MWIVLGLITIVAIILLNWKTIEKIKIGQNMNSYSEVKTQWTDIDFTTAIRDETPKISWTDDKVTYPALAKYRINGIFEIKNIIFVYGSDFHELQNIALRKSMKIPEEGYSIDPYFEDKNEQAYIFRSENNGKTFEKISLGHGFVESNRNEPIFVNNMLYIKVSANFPDEVRYYRSADLGKTWIENNWMPTFTWSDGTMFTYKSGQKTLKVSIDKGKTWDYIDGALKSFYDKTDSLNQLDDDTLVGLTKDKKILFFDLKTFKEEIYNVSIPKGKVISWLGINTINGKNEFYLRLYDNITRKGKENAYLESQVSLFFPMSNEHIQHTKKTPKIVLNISGDYIGGLFIMGYPVHVYSLDRGKSWKYEILNKYHRLYKVKYINGEAWFVAAKKEGTFLIKGKIE